MDKHDYLSGPAIRPRAIAPGRSVAELVDDAYLAYNAGRLREACELFTRKMLDPGCVVGMSLTGALTPAGLAMTCLVPLVEAGFVDWIVSTGANLYHDTHFGIGLQMHRGQPFLDDTELREAGRRTLRRRHKTPGARTTVVVRAPGRDDDPDRLTGEAPRALRRLEDVEPVLVLENLERPEPAQERRGPRQMGALTGPVYALESNEAAPAHRNLWYLSTARLCCPRLSENS